MLSYFQNTKNFNKLSNKEEFIRKLRNVDSRSCTWLPEPGNGFTNYYYYTTDNVEMFHHHSEHSIRLGTHLRIDSIKIGEIISNSDQIIQHYHNGKNDDKPQYGYGGINSQHSGLSHQVEAYIKRVPKPIDTNTGLAQQGYDYIGICNKVNFDRSDEKPLEIDIENKTKGFNFMKPHDTTVITVSASAGYPFAEPWSPNIDFKLAIELSKASFGNSTDIVISG